MILCAEYEQHVLMKSKTCHLIHQIKSIDVSIFLSCIHNQSDNTPTKFGT